MQPEDIAEKSSNEILVELFGAFNSEPPKSPVESPIHQREKHKKSKKSKKSKKKHKSKKKKKHSGSLSSDNVSSKHKKKQKTKVPVKAIPETIATILDEVVAPIPIVTEPSPPACVPLVEIVAESKKVTDQSALTNGTVVTSDKKTPTEFVKEDTRPPLLFDDVEKEEKKKPKIQILNLKNSAVFKAVEEIEKEKEAKKATYEEGEISDSSSSSSKEEHTEEEKVEKEESHVKSPSREKSHRKRSHSRSRSRRSPKRRRRSRSKSSSRRKRSSRNSHSPSRNRNSRDRYHSRSARSPKDRYSSDAHRSRSRASSERDRRKRSRHRSRDKIDSKDKEKYSSSKSRDRHGSKDTEKLRLGSKEKDRRPESSQSKDASGGTDKIDKKKLLAIARKNALKLIDAGVVPGVDKAALIKSGGKTVNELTEYCKKLAKKEGIDDNLSDINSDTSEEDDVAFHHPFQVRDRPNSIVMNIRNAIPLPVRSLQEKTIEQSKQLRMQFPVSSGNTHRLTESEWVPVGTPKEPPKAILPPPLPKVAPPNPKPHPLQPPPLPPMALQEPLTLSAVPPPPPPSAPVFPVIQPAVTTTAVTIEPDISAIVSKRLNAMRKLQENPFDSKAKFEISRAQTEMQTWAEKRTESGAFTGTTGAKLLTPAQLGSGTQAWAKRDQLIAANPVKGGMGMTLLQKMGWQPGEGLGKNKEGTLEPLKLEIKTDKKGLVATDEAWRSRNRPGGAQVGPALPTVKTLDGKHPVSLLNEHCNRKRWSQPIFELAFECGPDHKKNFLFKVRVNGVEYKPSIASANKKQAKTEAAAICLRALGLISTPNPPAPPPV